MSSISYSSLYLNPWADPESADFNSDSFALRSTDCTSSDLLTTSFPLDSISAPMPSKITSFQDSNPRTSSSVTSPELPKHLSESMPNELSMPVKESKLPGRPVPYPVSSDVLCSFEFSIGRWIIYHHSEFETTYTLSDRPPWMDEPPGPHNKVTFPPSTPRHDSRSLNEPDGNGISSNISKLELESQMPVPTTDTSFRLSSDPNSIDQCHFNDLDIAVIAKLQTIWEDPERRHLIIDYMNEIGVCIDEQADYFFDCFEKNCSSEQTEEWENSLEVEFSDNSAKSSDSNSLISISLDNSSEPFSSDHYSFTEPHDDRYLHNYFSCASEPDFDDIFSCYEIEDSKLHSFEICLGHSDTNQSHVDNSEYELFEVLDNAAKSPDCDSLTSTSFNDSFNPSPFDLSCDSDLDFDDILSCYEVDDTRFHYFENSFEDTDKFYTVHSEYWIAKMSPLPLAFNQPTNTDHGSKSNQLINDDSEQCEQISVTYNFPPRNQLSTPTQFFRVEHYYVLVSSPFRVLHSFLISATLFLTTFEHAYNKNPTLHILFGFAKYHTPTLRNTYFSLGASHSMLYALSESHSMIFFLYPDKLLLLDDPSSAYSTVQPDYWFFVHPPPITDDLTELEITQLKEYAFEGWNGIDPLSTHEEKSRSWISTFPCDWDLTRSESALYKLFGIVSTRYGEEEEGRFRVEWFRKWSEEFMIRKVGKDGFVVDKLDIKKQGRGLLVMKKQGHLEKNFTDYWWRNRHRWKFSKIGVVTESDVQEVFRFWSLYRGRKLYLHILSLYSLSSLTLSADPRLDSLQPSLGLAPPPIMRSEAPTNT
ncbi:hypothetical protein K435DRAFT_849358 [Dendrothele bispora CBS 962.96]|uniref:Uncharacterized protein n=1 Tax=Dendrothele bispora (strain CBS 962.96) TaxID=1314807 RepID=A0A4S8MTE0_DENBC|nr:hypothetical protein K435DRAFT_849358 [Dendrothele bispora CBS 962.96]